MWHSQFFHKLDNRGLEKDQVIFFLNYNMNGTKSYTQCLVYRPKASNMQWECTSGKLRMSNRGLLKCSGSQVHMIQGTTLIITSLINCILLINIPQFPHCSHVGTLQLSKEIAIQVTWTALIFTVVTFPVSRASVMQDILYWFSTCLVLQVVTQIMDED